MFLIDLNNNNVLFSRCLFPSVSCSHSLCSSSFWQRSFPQPLLWFHYWESLCSSQWYWTHLGKTFICSFLPCMSVQCLLAVSVSLWWSLMFTFGLPRHTWCLRGWEEFSSTSCQGYWLWRDHLSHPKGKNCRTILSIIKSFVCFSFIAPIGLSLMQNGSHCNGLDIPEITHSIMKKDSYPLMQKEFPSFGLSQVDHKKR